MLTPEEEKFFVYWSRERLRKKQFMRKLSIGLPLGVLVFGGTIISLLSGWYQKAEMALNTSSSLLLMILIACTGIVVFITIFGARHKWDQNELHYNELLAKKEKEEKQQDASITGLDQ